jgi:hypothetical protein
MSREATLPTIPRALETGEAPSADGGQVPAEGYTINGTFIVDPRRSECGRFEVDPAEYYGLTEQEVTALERANEGRDLL